MKQREVGFQDGASEGANTCDLFEPWSFSHVPTSSSFCFLLNIQTSNSKALV